MLWITAQSVWKQNQNAYELPLKAVLPWSKLSSTYGPSISNSVSGTEYFSITLYTSKISAHIIAKCNQYVDVIYTTNSLLSEHQMPLSCQYPTTNYCNCNAYIFSNWIDDINKAWMITAIKTKLNVFRNKKTILVTLFILSFMFYKSHLFNIRKDMHFNHTSL